MKIYDAIYTAAVFLQLDDLTDKMNADGFSATDPDATLGDEQARELHILERCCNLVLHELGETFPLRNEVTVPCADGVAYSLLPSRTTHVCAVKKAGKKLNFSELYDRVSVHADGLVTVTVAVSPPEVHVGDLSPYPTDTPSARLLAYGIAREYCLIGGMTDEATLWDSRFVACATDESRPRREKHVRMRAWR